MIPFLVFLSLLVLLWPLGHWGIPTAFGWWTALRFALAGMFLLTASAHWGTKRKDLIRMVPSGFPYPALMVTATGILEILGAFGLMWATLAPYAAAGLFVLLIALFPANVYAARKQIGVGGRKATPLVPRTAIQLVLLTATALVSLGCCFADEILRCLV